MSLKKLYEPKDINWVLIPDVLSKIGSAILNDYDDDKKPLLKTVFDFSISSMSQHIDVDDSEAFLSILSGVEEPITEIRVALGVHGLGSRMTRGLYDFQLLSTTSEGVEVEFRRPNALEAIQLARNLEAVLQLNPYTPTIKEDRALIRKRTAFIAHAFNETGRSHAFELTKFFNLLGFEVATGEGYSPEKISAKIKRRLQSQEIVLVVLSEKANLTWLIQEAAGADFSRKPLILLVETGVDFTPGVLGDLEYVSFSRDHISDCFRPILEGLREIGYTFT